MTALIERLKSIVGATGWVEDAEELHPHVTEWRGVYEGKTLSLIHISEPTIPSP